MSHAGGPDRELSFPDRLAPPGRCSERISHEVPPAESGEYSFGSTETIHWSCSSALGMNASVSGITLLDNFLKDMRCHLNSHTSLPLPPADLHEQGICIYSKAHESPLPVYYR